MSVSFDDFLNEQLKDPEFRAEYEALQSTLLVTCANSEAHQMTGFRRKIESLNE